MAEVKKDSIRMQFNRVAEEYDGNRRRFIPCYDDFYENSTKLILFGGNMPGRVLDLGAGTGLLTSFWYQENPEAEYVLADIAEEMLLISRKRFHGMDTVRHQVLDYTEEFPEGDFDAVISALSIHHLEHPQKQSLFDRIYEALPSGGIFVNYDQFCAGTPVMNERFDVFWEKQLFESGLSEKDIELWKERRKLDRECSVEEEIAMLQRSGFTEVKCVYSYHKFSVIAAVKE